MVNFNSVYPTPVISNNDNCSDKWIVWITEAHTFETELSWNTLIEHTCTKIFVILNKDMDKLCIDGKHTLFFDNRFLTGNI